MLMFLVGLVLGFVARPKVVAWWDSRISDIT